MFPSRPLVVQFLVFWGADLTADPATWTATDLTDRWNTAVELKVTDGRSEGSKQAETSEATWSCFNTDGQLTPEDARSQWWPYVDAGTPCMWIVNAGEGEFQLFTGFFSSIKPTWPGRSRHLSLVEIRATGVLERLERGASKLKSPLLRAITAAGAVRHWPLDDGRDATQAASSLIGGAPMLLVGEPRMAAVDGPPGSVQRFPELVDDGAYCGALTAALSLPSTGRWTVGAWFRAEADELDAFVSPISWHTTGTWGAQWIITAVLSTGTDHILNLTTVAADGATAAVNTFGHQVYDGKWHYVRVSAVQTSPTVLDYALHVDGELEWNDTVNGLTIGQPADIKAGGFGNAAIGGTSSLSVAHPAVYNTESPADVYSAGLGHAGETASARIARLCLEEGIPCTVDAGDSALMGPQPEDTFVELLRLCETTDLGRLSERSFGVHYRPASTLLNQPAAFVIDAAQRELREPFDPVRDLQRLRNEWAVRRLNGSEAVYRDVASQRQRGRLDDTADVNAFSDAELVHHTSWRTRISTARGMRYPGIGINLARSPRLIAPWQQLQLGDRVQAVNLPPQHPPGPLDQLIEGRVQVIKGRRVWRAALITSSAAPYTVGIIEDDLLGRLDAGESDRLGGPLAAGTTTFTVAYDDQVPWGSTGGFPLLVEVGGEHIEISGIAAPLADPFSRTVSNGWGNEPTTGQPYELNTTPSAYSATGAVGRISTVATNQLYYSVVNVGAPDHTVTATETLPVVPAGAAITLRAAGRWGDASNYYEAQVAIGTGGGANLNLNKRVNGVLASIAGGVSVGTHAAGNAWTIVLDVRGSTVRARAWNASTGSDPQAWQRSATDADLTRGTRAGAGVRREGGNTNGTVDLDVDNLSVAGVQTFTVRNRAVNGVSKAHAAGAPVRVVDAFVIS